MKGRELEKAEERTARELIELLNELRVILPGVQVLFAFLLMVPFTQRFPDLDDLETGVFFMTLLCTAVATALLIAPSAHHRILWRLASGNSGWCWVTYSPLPGSSSSCLR
jgi:hypothetical protein